MRDASGLRRRRPHGGWATELKRYGRNRQSTLLPHPLGHHIVQLRAGVTALVPHLALTPGSRVLDFGCGDSPYRDLFPPDVEYVGADLERNPRASLVLNADGTVPEGTPEFDAVFSTQVLEHVRDPQLYLSEAFRVLRPGGRLLLTTHGIFFYHPDPADLWRWTCEGLRTAVEDAGFVIEQFNGIIGLAATGLQLFQDAISFHMGPRLTAWLAAVSQPLVKFADRFETPESLAYNAQVFGLVAVKR